jgi:mannose-6-phosphate isomerase-like protein (cupin superfamily)
VQTIDIDLSPSAATQAAANTKPTESIAFDRGRQSLDHSFWYNGSLMTFLTTGEDTQGQFALIEAVSHIHRREDEIFYVLEGELAVSVGGRTMKAVLAASD